MRFGQNISETVRVETWFQRTINKKWHMVNQMVIVLITSHDPNRGQGHDPNTFGDHYLDNTW